MTRKITRAIADIKAGRQDKLYLGNLEAKRDWGYAPEYVEVMWRILQQDDPDDFAIGTGESHSVREFLEEAFGYAGLDWNDHVQIDPRYYRPTEVEELQADASRAKAALGWKRRIGFEDLVRIMVDSDLEDAGLESHGEGKKILERKFDPWHRNAEEG